MRRDSPASGRGPQFTEDHEAFRELAWEFVEKEIGRRYDDWEKAGRMPREIFEKLGALGMMGMAIPEEYGGSGQSDYRYNVVLQEEAARAMVTTGTVRTLAGSDPALLPALRQGYLPPDDSSPPAAQAAGLLCGGAAQVACGITPAIRARSLCSSGVPT